ncbi:L-methionine sulfoximine/L-methionine sulfone acetyltransferase [Pandoraea cepalis]|uniref:L-methionine sulfoximine/L-methionine sulfone acetyltransferase n=1 Tax=Pandoraea cepalis TaxID=2508294 RepID=A0A5E4RB93_9BURK|nr:GNAT family N-acetyltransferase [Pandoraea cepalis]VVD60063.1 L-methionine sulfoximine/L-methionine sulfone acetyltransferase [Pandoraea cepalis]
MSSSSAHASLPNAPQRVDTEPARGACTVRPVRDDDLPTLTAIYAHHVRTGTASFEEVPPDEAEMRARCTKGLDAGLPYLVAERDGKVLGYAYATHYRPRSAYRFTLEDSVYIAADSTGQGVGRALLLALIARCEGGPWRQLVANVGDSGNAASLALHKACGFTQTGVLKSVGFKFGRWIDTVLMQRPLNAGDATLPASVEPGQPPRQNGEARSSAL